MTDFRQQLAREGWGLTVYTIAKPKGTIHANQAADKRKTDDRQIRQDDNQTDSAERTISQPEDSNAQID